MSKPNLFVVGAAKSGTSSLVSYLEQHRDVFVSGIKEPAFYVEDAGYSDWAEYLSLFSGRSEAVLCESSTGYLYEKSAPYKIKSNHPDAKIIIILRNPIDMAFSYWQYMQMGGDESSEFLEAISKSQVEYRKTEKFKSECKNWWCSYLYIDRAMYAEQISRYLDVFDSSKVKICFFEKFVNSPDEVLNDILQFLGLDEANFETEKAKNIGGKVKSKFLRDYIYHRQYPLLKRIFPPQFRERVRFFVRDINRTPEGYKISDTEREFLRGVFWDDVARLKLILEDDIPLWKDFQGDVRS